MSKRKVKLYSSAKGYNLAAPQYDSKEAYLNSFEKSQLLDLLTNVTGKKVLDVGAGTGRVSLELARRGATVTALDISEGMLGVLKRKNKQIVTVVADAEQLPFPDESFDIVLAAFLIVHLKNPKYFFDEAYRVLADGGKLIITNINQKDPPVVKTVEGDIVIESYYHQPEHLRELLADLAFGIEQELFVQGDNTWVNQIIVAKK